MSEHKQKQQKYTDLQILTYKALTVQNTYVPMPT